MNKEITAALRSIGLTEFQADLYLAVLKNPIASVLELAKITGKNRQQIYNDGELLVTMGLLEKTSRQKRKYIASSPKKIIELAKEKEQKAKESLEKISLIAPELERLIGNYKTSISTKFYEGEAQIKEAYERELMLAKNTEVFSLVGEIEEVFKIFPEEYWGKWNKKFVKNGSSSKMIANNTDIARESAKNDTTYNRKTKYIDGFKLKINIDIFGNNTLLVSFRDKFAIWIESEVVATSYKTLFEILWNSAKS